MNIDDIKKCLQERGYKKQEVEILSEDLNSIHKDLFSCLEKWVNSGMECDYSSHGISINELINKYGLKYPAALLSIDWVIKEPEIAIPAIEKGIR